MEESGEFLPRLEKGLDARRLWLDGSRGPQLLEALRLHLAQFEGLVGLLVRKGLLRDNPEAYLQLPEQPGLPPDDPIPENEKREQVSWRLLLLRKQLELASIRPQLTTAELDDAQLKSLSAMIGWIPWTSLSEQSSSPTVRVVTQYVNGIRLGTDRVTAMVAKDAVTQLSMTQREVVGALADFWTYVRERWKLEARRKLLPRLAIARDRAAKPEEVRRAARRLFPVLMPGETFHADLFDEIVAEDSGERGGELRAALLARLAKREELPPSAKIEPPHPDRRSLLDSLRALARAEGELASAVATITVNAERSSGSSRGIRRLLRRLLEAIAGRRRRPRILEIELPEEPGVEARTERIELESFLAACRRKVDLLASLAEDGGQTWNKLCSADDTQLIQFIDDQLTELRVLAGRMAGVNARLQASVPHRYRSQLKGIRLELAAVKNFVIKAENRKREYTSRLEELARYQQLVESEGPTPGDQGADG